MASAKNDHSSPPENKALRRRIIVHGLVGATVGYLLLHPAFMLADYFIPYSGEIPVVEILLHSFALHHFDVAVFFIALGFFVGAGHGFLTYRIKALREIAERLSTAKAMTMAYNRVWGYDRRLDGDRNKKKSGYHPEQKGQCVKVKAASPGMAMGPLVHFNEHLNFISLFQKPFDNIDALGRFNDAVEQAKVQLNALQKEAGRKEATDAASIFHAHSAMLSDVAFIGSIRQLIKGGEPAPKAILAVTSQYIDRFSEVKDPYIQQKVQDVKDIVLRIMRNLMEINPEQAGLGGCIVVAGDLLPSDLLKISSQDAKGIIVFKGGDTGHVVILAKSLEIPLVIADYDDFPGWPDGSLVLLDADLGDICLNPSESDSASFKEKMRLRTLAVEAVGRDERPGSRTSDGTPVSLMVNVNLLSDLKALRLPFCDGIGLYRTEFSFLDHSVFPSEEEQYTVYRLVAQRGAGKIVTFRTMDLGGDKSLFQSGTPDDLNPLLGMKSIRFLLKNPVLFVSQVRAILRAGAGISIRVMFPMIASLDEFLGARDVVRKCEEDLTNENIPHAQPVAIGLMLEMPSVVDIIDELSREADFLALGTNDFIQYMLAVDRNNESCADFYLPHSPSVLRAIKRIVEGAGRFQKPVCVCGEMARDPRYLPFLLGIGIRQLSAEPVHLHSIRQAIARIDIKEAERAAENLLRSAKAVDAYSLLARV